MSASPNKLCIYDNNNEEVYIDYRVKKITLDYPKLLIEMDYDKFGSLQSDQLFILGIGYCIVEIGEDIERSGI
jgi:hypothetical protein